MNTFELINELEDLKVITTMMVEELNKAVKATCKNDEECEAHKTTGEAFEDVKRRLIAEVAFITQQGD